MSCNRCGLARRCLQHIVTLRFEVELDDAAAAQDRGCPAVVENDRTDDLVAHIDQPSDETRTGRWFVLRHVALCAGRSVLEHSIQNGAVTLGDHLDARNIAQWIFIGDFVPAAIYSRRHRPVHTVAVEHCTPLLSIAAAIEDLEVIGSCRDFHR